jgi:hypothetical protein
MTYVGKIGKAVLPRTSCYKFLVMDFVNDTKHLLHVDLAVVFLHVGEVRLSVSCRQQWACCSSPRWYVSMEPWWNDIDRGKTIEPGGGGGGKSTNAMWTDSYVNLGLCDERPVANCVSYGMAWIWLLNRTTEPFMLTSETLHRRMFILI